MSLAGSQARLIMLTRYTSDLEFGMQMIAQKRSTIAYQAQVAAERYPEMGKQFHLMDKKLEAEMKKLETQHKIAAAEYDSVKKMIDNSIKKDFKYA